MMGQLHLIDADDRQINAIKGVRAALVALGAEDHSLRRAQAVVDEYRRAGVALIGTSDSDEAVRDAALRLEADSAGAARAGVDLTPAELTALCDPEPAQEAKAFADAIAGAENGAQSATEDEDELPSYEACKVALVLMAASNGNPNGALALAGSLRINTDDPLYQESAAVLLDAFPPPVDGTPLAVVMGKK